MKPFYFSVNNSGYYRVHFVDPITGKRLNGKSTHCKDKVEATLIAAQWLKDGVPSQRANSRAFESVLRPSDAKISPDLKSFVNRLSENALPELIALLSERFGSVPVLPTVSDFLNVDVTNSWRLPTKMLYEAYLLWCGSNNERALSQKGLAIRMQEKGFKRGLSNGVRFWLGIAVKPEWMGRMKR